MRRGESVPTAFQAPVDVHASADGQVYMFRGRLADSGGSSEEDELNVMELRPRGRDSEERERERVGDVMLLERDVTQGDNLNKLALQYGCKVGTLKLVYMYCMCQSISYGIQSISVVTIVQKTLNMPLELSYRRAKRCELKIKKVV